MRLAFFAFTAVFSLLAVPNGVFGERPTLHGIVLDEAGERVDHATVLIFRAGPKHGYSLYCPSCYADCGKRAITAADGSFSIRNLDPSLHFEILALREGFEPSSLKNVDPAMSVPVQAVLRAREAVARDPRGLVRGRVVNDHGVPLRDVVVSVEGLSIMTDLTSQPGKQVEANLYFFGGTKEGLENVAVSDDRGQFELSYKKQANAMLLEIEGRGYAPKWQVAATGERRGTIILDRGAAIRGRLVDHGKPVANAEVAIVPVHQEGFGYHLKSVGDPYDEIRVGTKADGTFTLADVPAHVRWLTYVTTESMGQRGTIQPVECLTNRASEIVELGDLKLIPGHRLRGVVRIADGRSVPPDLTMRIFSAFPRNSAAVPVRGNGEFEFMGLPSAHYDLSPETRDYRVTEPVSNLLVDRDISDLKITLEAVKR